MVGLSGNRTIPSSSQPTNLAGLASCESSGSNNTLSHFLKSVIGMYGPPPSCKRKVSLAVGLRQCIRPLVESMTPGLDGHPLAFAPINWTVWLGPFPISGSESVGSTHCHLSPQANREGTVFLNRDFRWTQQGRERDSVPPCTTRPRPFGLAYWPTLR